MCLEEGGGGFGSCSAFQGANDLPRVSMGLPGGLEC